MAILRRLLRIQQPQHHPFQPRYLVAQVMHFFGRGIRPLWHRKIVFSA